jgi:hypothetical protein
MNTKIERACIELSSFYRRPLRSDASKRGVEGPIDDASADPTGDAVSRAQAISSTSQGTGNSFSPGALGR